MSRVHFNLNRPIHLARRDAFFERAAELLNIPIQDMELARRQTLAQTVLRLLQASERHAFFAARSADTIERERDFQRVLRLIIDNVESIAAMWLQQSNLVEEQSSLCRFLQTGPEQCVLPAMHYQRRAEDIHQGLSHVLQLLHVPYRKLQQTVSATLKPDERKRYKKAYAAFNEEARSRFPAP